MTTSAGVTVRFAGRDRPRMCSLTILTPCFTMFPLPRGCGFNFARKKNHFQPPVFVPWDQSFHYCTIILPEWNYPPDSSYNTRLSKTVLQMFKGTTRPYALLRGNVSECARSFNVRWGCKGSWPSPPKAALNLSVPTSPQGSWLGCHYFSEPPPQGITVVSPAPGSELIHRLLTVFKRSLNVLIVLDWRDAAELLTFIF